MNLPKTDPLTTLTDELTEFLENENLVLLSTIDASEPVPNLTAISWVKPADSEHVRFSVTTQSRMLENIRHNPNVILTVIAGETVYSIKGKASILEEPMPGVSLKLTKVEVKVSQVFESMFWGAKITQVPQFVKTYNPEKAKKLDDEVYKALMK